VLTAAAYLLIHVDVARPR